jgi:aerobic carbon-monoxide dehydrogenase medium subunit
VRSAGFAYVRPNSVAEAVDRLRSEAGAARVLAGGQSLLPQLYRREIRPAALVDIGGLAGLRYLTRDGDGLRVGALTTHADIERDTGLAPAFGVLPETARLIGHLPIRTRGTFGGSIAFAAPCSEWCLLAVLLDAAVVLQGPDGERVVAAEAFFLGPHQTVATFDELVVEVRFPSPAPNAALVEHSIQRGELAQVAAAAAIDTDGAGRVVAARLALDGATDRAVRLPDAERALHGTVPDAEVIAEAAGAAVAGLEPGYRTEVAEALVARATRAALEKAENR